MGKSKDLTIVEKYKIKIFNEEVYFGDIKGALQRSWNNEEGCCKYD